MKKPAVTRTLGPIHFEDLEPHRFEDLVRELLYDYKDWQSIEATGRSGSDGGFDVRAYEKNTAVYNAVDFTTEDNAEEITGSHPMDGNLWMVQCKRESEVGPAKVKSIINENMKAVSPPYGYILVAPANFSTKSYDTFREELKKLGVMEFYLWGKAELEDMLHMPKFDRILFTFFGISLVSRQRAKSTELRSRIVVKNKLYKLLGEGDGNANTPLMIRDINDDDYPWEPEEKTEGSKPRWLKHNFAGNHVHGIWIELARYYGYYDESKNEWDMATGLDTNKMYEEGETEEERIEKMNNNKKYRKFWGRLPYAMQTDIMVWGLLNYEDIVLVDEKGDPQNNMVHIYMDFKYNQQPFSRIIHLTEDDISIEYAKATRITIFPDPIPEFQAGKVYKDKQVSIPDQEFEIVGSSHSILALYHKGKKLAFLKVGDIIQLKSDLDGAQPRWIEITYKVSTKVQDYIQSNNVYNTMHFIKNQLGEDITEQDTINVYEYQFTHQPEP